MNTLSNRRIVWIDWAKTILIYLMVVGHCLPAPWESTLIYAFHMPAFFIISGYLYRQHNWWRTVKSFVVPVAFFSAINFVIYAIPKIFKGTFNTENLFEKLIIPFWGPGKLPADEYIILFPGVWFIIALLLGRLLIGDLKFMSWVSRYWKSSLLILVLFLSIEPFLIPDNPLRAYKFYLVIPSLPFILLGYGLKEKLTFEWVKPWMVVLSIVIFIAVSLFSGRKEILNCRYGDYYLFYMLNAILGGGILYYACSKFSQSKVIEVFSKGTLLIMAFNILLHNHINFFFEKIGLGILVNDTLVFPWISALLIMLICYYPIKWLLNHYPLLLGK